MSDIIPTFQLRHYLSYSFLSKGNFQLFCRTRENHGSPPLLYRYRNKVLIVKRIDPPGSANIFLTLTPPIQGSPDTPLDFYHTPPLKPTAKPIPKPDWFSSTRFTPSLGHTHSNLNAVKLSELWTQKPLFCSHCSRPQPCLRPRLLPPKQITPRWIATGAVCKVICTMVL
jgi:hypothetical protein